LAYPVSDHCDGERFFNPHAVTGRTFLEVVRWARTRERTEWPRALPLVPYRLPPAPVVPGQVAITFIGHATFLIRTARTTFITDPVFTSHAGPFGITGPRRVRPPALSPSQLPQVNFVLLSHNHYDHLQPSSLALFEGTPVIAPLGVGRYLHRGGHGTEGARELDWWQTANVGAEVTCVPAQHFSARTPWDKNRTLWCGFVVRVDGVTIYFAGDSGYSPQFAEIGERCPGIDVALIPIGAYEPRWFMTPMHMNPDEAVRAHLDVRPRLSIGMHFGTFQLTDEGIDEPLEALDAARAEHGVSADVFRTLDFGETLVFSQEIRRTGE
jgi:L-ascorbate metabolism protein UlaG (beta-lactamase superfamily)